MKKTAFVLLLVFLAVLSAGCGEKKILHCDQCGIEVDASQYPNMEEDWQIFCEACNEILFPEDGLFPEPED